MVRGPGIIRPITLVLLIVMTDLLRKYGNSIIIIFIIDMN